MHTSVCVYSSRSTAKGQIYSSEDYQYLAILTDDMKAAKDAAKKEKLAKITANNLSIVKDWMKAKLIVRRPSVRRVFVVYVSFHS